MFLKILFLAVMEIKQMVNGLREQIQVSSASNVTSPRSAFSGSAQQISPQNNNNYSTISSPLDMNRLNQRVQESKTPFFIGRTHFCTTNLEIW